ncbi:MAG: accessory Sec system glycosyltransferase GtfB, partial [Acetatifactor sp.]|nr:accessory Sec system glycosyltransferase GtfB [Acetatifactor sp.]
MRVVLDKYTDEAEKLLETMRRTEACAGTVVLRDDGFLPNTIFPVYEYFTYGRKCKAPEEKNLHYAFLEVPEFWEIRTSGLHGAVYDMGCKKAEIYFTEYHNLERVEWLMDESRIYKIDYYNKYALKYASEFLDEDGKTESKVFYSDNNREVMVKQPQSDTITLLDQGRIKALFTSYAEFIQYFFAETGSEEGQVLFVQDQEGLRLSALQAGGKSVWESVWFSSG